MNDLQLVIRKELRDLMGPSKTRTQTIIGVTFLVVLVDFLFPLTQRDYVMSLSQVLGFSIMITIMVIITSAPDMVAGERERHTLETLLSTRLRDRTLVQGKIIAMLIVSSAVSL